MLHLIYIVNQNHQWLVLNHFVSCIRITAVNHDSCCILLNQQWLVRNYFVIYFCTFWIRINRGCVMNHFVTHCRTLRIRIISGRSWWNWINSNESWFILCPAPSESESESPVMSHDSFCILMQHLLNQNTQWWVLTRRWWFWFRWLITGEICSDHFVICVILFYPE